jgi:hypothetical protein
MKKLREALESMNIENSLKKLYKSAEEVKKSKELAEKLDESQLEKLKSH